MTTPDGQAGSTASGDTTPGKKTPGEQAVRDAIAAGDVVNPEAPVWRGIAPANWYPKALISAKGAVLSVLANALLALREDPAWHGVLAFDEMEQAVMLVKPVPVHGAAPGPLDGLPRPIRDDDVTVAQEWLQVAGMPGLTKDTAHQAVDRVARERGSYHPVRDYLEGLNWDGVPRLVGGTTNDGEIILPWLVQYLGAEDTAYIKEIGRMMLIGAVARVFLPGCKADYMVILEGEQGTGKSTACSILGGEWFSDSMPENLGSKDAQQHLRGRWFIELAELHALSRSEVAALKAFLTRSEDIYRPSYGRKDVHQPRQCVFVGTTNRTTYLRDETGGRRFWPVKTGTIDTDALACDRDQLFAEAIRRFRVGERWHPDAAFERDHIRPEQDARFEADAWEDKIARHLIGVRETTIGDVMKDGLNIETGKWSTADQRRVTAIMERLGWVRGRRTGRDGARRWINPTLLTH